MLQGRDIVVLTYSDWFATQSSPQHLTRAMARSNRVLYVDVPRSFLRFLRGTDPQDAGKRYPRALERQGDSLWVFHPPHVFLPVGGLPVSLAKRMLALNGRLLARQLRKVLDFLQFKEVLLWNFSPIHGGAIPFLDKRMVIHDICDHWSNYQRKRAARELLEWMDCKLAEEADVLFVFSQYMLERRAQCNPETHVVLPGGDVEHYGRAALAETPVPLEMQALPRPLIGAICVLDPYRFDATLLAYLARARPDWTLAVIGPIQSGVDLAPVEGIENVRILGNRPLSVMPEYLKSFDVALIPYALNDATRGIYPMKTQEYLAGGKPVVAPPLPACLPLSDVVYFAGNHEAFGEKIAQALAEDNAERVAQRRAVAAQNGWEYRMEERSVHVERLLAGAGC